MSRETREWLSSNVLVGFTDKRGHAWHYKKGDNNHYTGAIPVGEVERRLFSWEPVTNILACPCGCGDNFKSVQRSDNRHRMGMFREGYEPHSYREWLLNAVSNLLGDTLQVGSAGLLRKGAVAWVSVETPETLKTAEGVEYRPHLLATTSFDGSIATTYKPVSTFVVCDNTREMALREWGASFKVKHTRNSQLKLTEAREALGLISSIAEETEAEIKELCETTVTDRQWFDFLDAYVPMDHQKDSKRSLSMADTKRGKLTAMYRWDQRAAIWKGTAFGVLQAVDTYIQHEQTVRGAERPERNMLSVITGSLAKDDRAAMDTLRLVLAAA